MASLLNSFDRGALHDYLYIERRLPLRNGCDCGSPENIGKSALRVERWSRIALARTGETAPATPLNLEARTDRGELPLSWMQRNAAVPSRKKDQAGCGPSSPTQRNDFFGDKHNHEHFYDFTPGEAR